MRVRVVQERDAAGMPAPMVFVEQVRQARALQTWPDAVMGFLRPLNPSRIGKEGVYRYNDPARGSGVLYVEGANQLHLSRIDELVHMEEIERTIGMKDPIRIEDLPLYLVPFVVRARSPYLQLFLASLGLLVFVGCTVGPFTTLRHASVPELIMLYVLAAVSLGASGFLIVRNCRRLRWWHAARAQAKRDGGPMPEDLQILG